jgi:hypothetical protein
MPPRNAGGPPVRYLDRSEISEVFADRLERLSMDGGVIRMEFTVIRTEPTRTSPGKPSSEPERFSYTAARVVMSPRGAAEMLNKMRELESLLLQQGIVQPLPNAADAAGEAPAAVTTAPSPSGAAE